MQPCVHSLVHLPRKVLHLRPPVCSSQWMLKQTIRNLGEEIKQHSNPFANLSQHGIRRIRVNALKVLISDLDLEGSPHQPLPCSLKDLGGGFVLLCACEETVHPLRECEADALHKILPTASRETEIHMRRWAKLHIPTGQNCYSSWKEKQKPLNRHRTARNVKVSQMFTILIWDHSN
jgi:hypothetical protein